MAARNSPHPARVSHTMQSSKTFRLFRRVAILCVLGVGVASCVTLGRYKELEKRANLPRVDGITTGIGPGAKKSKTGDSK